MIVGHEKFPLSCFARTIYRMFQKRLQSILDECGYPGGDTIVGLKHKTGVITIVKRLSKIIMALKLCDKRAIDIKK